MRPLCVLCVCVCCNTLPCEQFTSKSAKNTINNKTSSLFIKFVAWLLFRGVLESFSVSLEACRAKVVLGNFKKALNLVPVEEGIVPGVCMNSKIKRRSCNEGHMLRVAGLCHGDKSPGFPRASSPSEASRQNCGSLPTGLPWKEAHTGFEQ